MTIARRTALALAALAPFAAAQKTKTVPRIAYVYLFRIGPSAPFADAFSSRLAELGWIDGKTIHIDYRDADGDPKKLSAIMRELVEAKIDVIVASCTPEAMAAKKETSTIPIVVAATGDPVRSGLAATLGRPGGNVTGVSAALLELSAKRMEMLKELAPRIKSATVLWNPARGDNAVEVEVMQGAARQLGMELKSIQVRDTGELDFALDLMSNDRTQGITETGDPFMFDNARRIIEFAARRRLPSIYDNRFFVDLGGLMSYGANLPVLHRRAADYVDKVLKGTKPADMPFEQPTRFELVINHKTAKAFGITIPRTLLLRADEVIR